MKKLLVCSLIALASSSAFAESMSFKGSAAGGVADADVFFDLTNHSLKVSVQFDNVALPITGAHIHCCDPSASGSIPSAVLFPTFPTGVTSGSFNETYDTLNAATYSATFKSLFGGDIAQAEQALYAGMLGGKGYFSAHLTTGSIRANLAAVPEPSSVALVFAGLGVVAAAARRRQQGAAH